MRRLQSITVTNKNLAEDAKLQPLDREPFRFSPNVVAIETASSSSETLSPDRILPATGRDCQNESRRVHFKS